MDHGPSCGTFKIASSSKVSHNCRGAKVKGSNLRKIAIAEPVGGTFWVEKFLRKIGSGGVFFSLGMIDFGWLFDGLV